MATAPARKKSGNLPVIGGRRTSMGPLPLRLPTDNGDSSLNDLPEMNPSGEEQSNTENEGEDEGVQVIRGITAKPNAGEEDWEVFFDFQEKDKGVADVATPMTLATPSKTLRNTSGVMQTDFDTLLATVTQANISVDKQANVELAPTVEFKAEQVEEQGETVKELWEAGLRYFRSGAPADALDKFGEVHKLMPTLLPTDDLRLFDGCLLLLMSQSAKSISDIFLQRDLLEKAQGLFPDFACEPNEMQLKAAVLYELGVLDLPHDPETSLSRFIKFICVHLYGGWSVCKTAPGGECSWVNVGRGCREAARALSQLKKKELAAKFAAAAMEIGKKSQDAELQAPLDVPSGGASATSPRPTPTKSKPQLQSQPKPKMEGVEDWGEEFDISFPDEAPALALKGGHDSNETSELKGISCKAAPEKENETSKTDKKEDEDEGEDWDAELGISSEPRVNLASALSGATPVVGSGDSDSIPQRWQILDTKHLEILRYPSPPWLFSIKTESGFSFLHEEELEEWLSSIIKKHIERGNTIQTEDRDKWQGRVRCGSASSIATAAQQAASAAVNTSRELLQAGFSAYEERATKYAKENAKFGADWMRSMLRWLYKLKKKHQRDRCWECTHALFIDLKECAFTTALLGSSRKKHAYKKEQKVLFESCMVALELVGRQWKLDEQTSWQDMLHVAKAIYPNFTPLVVILEQEVYAHVMLKRNDKTMDDWSAHSFDPDPVSFLGDLCLRYAPEEESSNIARLAMCRALADLHLISCNLSPLTCACAAADCLSENSEVEIEFEDDRLSQQSRGAWLLRLYYKVPLCWLKAKACLVLGLLASAASDGALAQKLFFETTYILDTIPQLVEGHATAVCEFGYTALTYFGRALVHSYQYQILCFEAATLVCYLMRKRQAFRLLQQVAETAALNDDLPRSIVEYKVIYRKYVIDNRTNEAVHVCNLLSSLYLDQGDFENAEGVMREGIALMSQRFMPTDPQALKMHQKLAEVMLKSYNMERGLEYLEWLRTAQGLPKRKKQSLLVLLIRAYTKKGWTSEAIPFFANLNCADLNNSWESSFSVSDVSTAKSIATSLKYWELAFKTYYAARDYPAALYAADVALKLCPEMNLSSRAKYNYHRGKTLERLCFDCPHQTFPSPLRREDILIDGSGGTSTVASTPVAVTFTSPADVFQEAISCFNEAIRLYGNSGDDIRRTKVMTHLSGLYLRKLFLPVMLLHIPYSDVGVMPMFKNGKSTEKSFAIALCDVEKYALAATDAVMDTFALHLLPACYMNMAELRLLQSKKEAAISYWKECRDLVFQLYMDGPTYMFKSAPASNIAKMLNLFGRMVKFLFCMDKEFINQNLMVVDTYITLEINMEQAQKRGFLETSSPASDAAPASPAVPGISPRSPAATPSAVMSQPPLSVSAMTPMLPPEMTPARQGIPLLSCPTPCTPFTGAGRLSVMDLFTAVTSTPAAVTGVVGPGVTESPMSSPPFKTPVKRSALATEITRTPTSPSMDATLTNSLHESAATSIWGHFYKMKTSMRKYCIGKISRQQLVSRNQECFRSLLKTAASARTFSSPNLSPPSRNSRSTLSTSWTPGKSPISANSQIFSTPASASKVMGVAARDEADFTYGTDLLYNPETFAKLVFLIQIDGLLVYYVPVTGQLTIDHLGAAHHERDTAFSGPMHVRVVLLQSPQEWASFSVLPQSSIRTLLERICRLFNESAFLEFDKKGKKGKFGSHGKQATINTPKFIECTSNFHANLEGLFDKLLSESKKSQQRQVTPKVLSFAKYSSTGGGSKSLTPTLLPPDSFVVHLFSGAELRSNSETDPCVLYLYGKAAHSIEQATEMFANSVIALSPYAMSFLESLVLYNCGNKSLEITPEESKQSQEVSAELAAVFKAISGMLPIPEPTLALSVASKNDPLLVSTSAPVAGTASPNPAATSATAPAGTSATPSAKSRFMPFFSKVETTAFKKVQDCPTVIVSSKNLQIIPWELVIGDTVVRYFSLYDIIRRLQLQAQPQSEQQPKQLQPSYFMCFHSQMERELAPFEDARREYLVRHVFHALRFSPKAPSLNRRCASIAPFHSPLVEHGKRIASVKRRFKYFSFFDMRYLTTTPGELLHFVDRLSIANAFPVLVLTYADLLDLSDTIMYICRKRYTCSLVFVPASRMEFVVNKLIKLHESYYRQQQTNTDMRSGYQWLMSLVYCIIKEYGVPIVVYNPPLSRRMQHLPLTPPVSPLGAAKRNNNGSVV
eukprot:TRINITY_DN2763_c0_g1_i4.p1 TRINITY_DN2763_c0_g1~~TRINITY_DN2763_c0_g1_i4.p1  ORF type:complete len:2232 (-),score=562.22 TRINITY_DN2763_c0_g1_i4:75-6770(-)